MNALRFSVVIALANWAFAATTGYAAEEDPRVYLQKELKIEFSTFGKGIAEAIRGMGKRAEAGEVSDYVVRSEQIGPGYKIKWITKKNEPDAPFPEYMKLSRVGAILPGDTILGKTNQMEIISRLGKPSAQVSGKLTYHLPANLGDDTAILTFHRGKLAVVEWHWNVE